MLIRRTYIVALRAIPSCISLAILVFAIETNAAEIQWKWLSGASISHTTSVCGVSGEFGGSFTPGSRYRTTLAVSSSDRLIYLFGGYGAHADQSDGIGRLGDLWEFSILKGEWAWLSGISNLRNYDTQYTGSAPYPGSREASVSWCTKRGLLYIFSGLGNSDPGSGNLNELWSFNVTTKTWRFIKGSKTSEAIAVFGIKGVSDSANTPGSVYNSVLLAPGLVFGGRGHALLASTNLLSDVWEFDDNWTWKNGPGDTSKTGVCGAKGQFDASYYPGGRLGCFSADMGTHIYIMGGWSFSTTAGPGRSTDIWAYRKSDAVWAYIAGSSNTLNTYAVFSGIQEPGSRYNGASWNDVNSGLFRVFGGYGLDSGNSGELCDIWDFNITTKLWHFAGGQSTIDQPGKFVGHWYSADNRPGGRNRPAFAMDGNAWYVGFGTGVASAGSTGFLNDFWLTGTHVDPYTSSPSPIPTPIPTVSPPQYYGLVISVIVAVSVGLPSFLKQVQQGVEVQGKSMSIGDVVDVLQFVAFTSQLSIPLSDTYVAFASSFTWCLPVISAPFEFVSKASSRRLLSLTQVFGSDAKHAALNYLPSLLFWAVIGLVCVFLYVFLIDMLRYALKKGRRYVRDKETGEVIAYWRRSLGMFLRFLVMIYYAMCYATLYALSLTNQWAGVFAMAIISLILICLGIPVLCAVLVYKARVQQDMFDDKQTLTLFGSLFAGYRMDRYWFTIPMLAQKFMLALSVAVVLDSSAQMSIILVVLLLVLIAMVLAKPHESPAMLKLWIAYASVRILIVVILFVSSFLMHQSSRDVLGVTAIVLQVLGVVVTMVVFIRPFIADLKLNESGPSWLRKREKVDMSVVRV